LPLAPIAPIQAGILKLFIKRLRYWYRV